MSSNVKNEDNSDSSDNHSQSSTSNETSTLDNKDTDSSSTRTNTTYESAYELEPFLLDKENFTLSLTAADEEARSWDGDDNDSPETFSKPSREALLEEKLREKLSEKGINEDDQVDTIPPESAPNRQIENQIEMKQSGVFAIPNLENAVSDEKDSKASAKEQEVIDEFISRKRSMISASTNDPNLKLVIGNRYRIESLIGQNYYSKTYKAREVATGNIYAAKTHQPDASDDDKKLFQKEIEIQSKLNHDNISKFVDKGKSPAGVLYSILEIPKGISLKDVLHLNGPISNIENFWTILGPICDALAYAHRQSIIHGNLHSGNIILTKGRTGFSLKVLDFGINSNIKLGQLKQTSEDTIDNTFLYFSPEQCSGKVQTSASDIYNLGVLAYELVTGKPPYYGKSAQDIVNGHLSSTISPAPIATEESHIPKSDQLERIIFLALDSDPDMRISSALEFKLVLKDWFDRATKNK